MQQLFSQFTIKDVVTYLLMGATLWYNTWGGQKDKDTEQDKLIQQQGQVLTDQVVPVMKENAAALQEVKIQLAVTRVQLEELSKKTK